MIIMPPIEPGYVIMGAVGDMVGGNSNVGAEHAQVVWWPDIVQNRSWPTGHKAGRGTPFDEITVSIDLYRRGNENMYDATLSIYEDPQNNAGTDPATYTDGTKLVTFSGSGYIQNGQRYLITWADQWPLVDFCTEIEIWPHNIDCSLSLIYRIPGDCNADGWITGIDWAQIDAGYLIQPANPTWENGDFNRDGRIDLSDFRLMEATELAQAVPEPATGMLLSIGALGLFKRRTEITQ